MKKHLAILAAILMGLSSCSCEMLYSLYRNPPEETEPPATEEPSGTEPLSLDLSDAGDIRVTLVELFCPAPDTAELRPAMEDAKYKNVPGRFGCVVRMSMDKPIVADTRLVFHYDPEMLDGVAPDDLLLLHYDDSIQNYDIAPYQLDKAEHTVTGYISQEGYYVLADVKEWSAETGGSPAELSHDTFYENKEFGFSMVIPEEIRLVSVSDYLKDDEEGKCKTLMECEHNDNIQIGIEYLERPYYDSAKDFVNTLAAGLDSNGYLQDTGTITESGGVTGYYLYSDFGEEGDCNGSVNCIFPMSDTQYINIWYGFRDTDRLSVVMDSLHSFQFTGEVNPPEPSANLVLSKELNTTAKDITVAPPEGVKAVPSTEGWTCEVLYGVNRVWIPLLDFSGTGANVKQVSVMLEDSLRNARKAATEDLNARRREGASPEPSQVKIGDEVSGFLFTIEEGNTVEMCGYYEIPDSHQYIRASVILLDSATEAERQAYRKMLETLDTTKGDAAIRPEDLKLNFPENFFADPSGDRGWAREWDETPETTFYRMWLYDTDHNKCSQYGNHDYCAAFFYLMETGRTAKEECRLRMEKYLKNEHFDLHIEEQAEVTLSGGQKGYLFCLREEKEEYHNCYMYGYYEIMGEDGQLSDQFVEIEFWLNEPVPDKAYHDYWNCLKTADIVKQ